MRSMEQVPVAEKTIRMTTIFGGYNHREIIQDGECFDMQNMSADLYPAMGTRRKRGITESEETLNGIAGRSELVLIRGEKVYYGEEDTGLEVSTDEAMLPKKIVSLGAYVCIWPDKVYFNTHDFSDKGNMERRWNALDHVDTTDEPDAPYLDAPVVQLCRMDGTEYDMTTITTAKTAPKNPADGKLWIDTSGDADVLRQYSADRKEWTEVPTVYVIISAPSIGAGLKQYDSVVISDLEYRGYWTGATPTNSLPAKVKNQLEAMNGSTIIYNCGHDYIVIAAMLTQTVNLFYSLSVDRQVPDMDYMCESGNRIWGCKYGTEKKPKTIYKSNNLNNVINLCDLEGNWYAQWNNTLTVSGTAPENPEDGARWIDNSGETDVLYRWDATEGEWKETTPYVYLLAHGLNLFGEKFEIGDYADITGIVGYWNLDRSHTPERMRAQAQALNGRHKVVGRIWQHSGSADKCAIIIEGIVEDTMNWTDLSSEYAVIRNERWDEGIFYNEIRACALGDFKNWSKYMGLSTDSYAASVGTDGPFTGAAAQAGYPVFFKENCIHKLYGAAPNSFQITTIMCRGVQEGSGRSVAVVNETILYKGLSDVMYFDGNMPQSIGENLGDVFYEDARAGTVNGKYYISMRHGNEWSLFCYDTKKGIWTREDNTRALGFGTVGDELYLIDEENNTLVTVNGTDGTQESGPVEWEAVFGISGIEYMQGGRADMHNHLYMSRFDMRIAMDADAEAELWIEYDSDGHWIPKGRIKRNQLGMIVLPVVPRRCDHLRAKITGRGGFRILSLSKVLEVGSDG